MEDCSLYLDRRGDLAKPGLHALLVGVSKYSYLPDDPANGDPDYRMASLASPALSAWVLARRLVQLAKGDGGRLHRPLKTLRLLVSPAFREIGSPLAGALVDGASAAALGASTDSLKDWAAKATATRRAIQRALYAWREDARESREATTLFYASGHGLQHGGNDAVLLAADFKAPYWTDLDRAMQLSSIRDGMAPTAGAGEIAATQFYFVDGCRNYNLALDKVKYPFDARRVFQDKLNDSDYRSFPTYFATADGDSAIASAGSPTYFCNALLDGLQRGASENEDGPDGGGWPVKGDTLKTAFDRYSEITGTKLVQVDGQRGPDAILCWFYAPPSVTLLIQLPGDYVNIARVRLHNAEQGVDETSALNAKGLHEITVPTGIYDIEIVPNDGNGFAPVHVGTRPHLISISRRLPWVLPVQVA